MRLSPPPFPILRRLASRRRSALGAEQAIDYTREDFGETAVNWTNGEGVRPVMDAVGGESFCKSFAATRLYGRMVTLLSTTYKISHTNTARLRNPSTVMCKSPRVVPTRIRERYAPLFEQGALKVHLSRVLRLEKAADAHRLIEAGHTMGKIVLSKYHKTASTSYLAWLIQRSCNISTPQATPNPVTSVLTAPSPPLLLLPERSICSQGVSPTNRLRKRAARI